MPLSIPVIANAFEDVNTLIVEQLRSDVGLVEDIGQDLAALPRQDLVPGLAAQPLGVREHEVEPGLVQLLHTDQGLALPGGRIVGEGAGGEGHDE